MKLTLASLALWLALLGASAAQAAPAPAPMDPAAVPFVARTVTIGTITYGFQVFAPNRANAAGKVPVILFLHGAGERGDDNGAQTRNGIRLLIAPSGSRFPALVVCPQCRPDKKWTDPDMQEMALKALDQSVQEFGGDPSRVYLTGLSLGGYGTWGLAQRYPERWAALAPCCGGILYPHQAPPPDDPYRPAAQKVKDAGLPAWVFHGGADPTVPVSESRQMVALLLSLGGEVKYTEYPGVGHDSWDYAYKEPGLLPWMLSHKRPK